MPQLLILLMRFLFNHTQVCLYNFVCIPIIFFIVQKVYRERINEKSKFNSLNSIKLTWARAEWIFCPVLNKKIVLRRTVQSKLQTTLQSKLQKQLFQETFFCKEQCRKIKIIMNIFAASEATNGKKCFVAHPIYPKIELFFCCLLSAHFNLAF